MSYSVNNLKNKFKVDEVLVQLIQVVAIKEDNKSGRADDQKVIIKHVQEILFEQHQQGLCAKDSTDNQRQVRISLAKILSKIIKQQEEEGIYGDL